MDVVEHDRAPFGPATGPAARTGTPILAGGRVEHAEILALVPEPAGGEHEIVRARRSATASGERPLMDRPRRALEAVAALDRGSEGGGRGDHGARRA